DAALAGPLTALHLVDAADEAANGGAGVLAATTTLGSASAGQLTVAPLALVSRETYFGPCASLARSRRIREAYIASNGDDYAFGRMNNNACINEVCCLVDADGRCPTMGGQYADACKGATNLGLCSDSSDDTPTPAVIELKTPIDVYVLRDLTPLL